VVIARFGEAAALHLSIGIATVGAVAAWLLAMLCKALERAAVPVPEP
jgi:hypothetical protein